MKNILLMIGRLTNGGSERSIVNLANELSKYHNVIIVTAYKESDYECNVMISEIKELRYRFRKIIGIYKLHKLKKKYNIDVSISYTTAYNFYNVISKYKDKVIISVRNYLSQKKEGLLLTLIHKLSMNLSYKIVCCSKAVMNDQIKNYHADKNKLFVIPNFCNEEFIQSVIDKKLYDNTLINDNTIISMARLSFHKGHQYIIEAMKYVVEDIKDARLLIFGRGDMEEELNNLIKKYNLENNVILMGFDSSPYAYINKSKAFVLASLYEGFPNVIIEAMTCGIPIISTDSYGGVKEILTDKNLEVGDITLADYGILIPNFNKKNIDANVLLLKDAILKILKDEKIYKKYCLKSKERIKIYKKDEVVKKWLEVIE